MLLESEIAEEYPVVGKSVYTPTGWKRVRTVYKTVPMLVWELRTENHSLRCSGHHLVKLLGRCEHVSNLRVGDWVDTRQGYDRVVSVSPTGKREALYDLTVDDEDGLFYSDDVVSHNSTTFAARQIINSHLYKGYKSLYIVPLPEQLKTYVKRYREMEGLFRADVGTQNLYNKLYANGSTVDFAYCLTSPNKVRGMTTHELLYDEVQGLDPDFIEEISYTQTTSKMPSTIFAGTALSVDTLLEQKWSESSLGCWHIKSPDGVHWLNMHDKDVLLKVCSNPQGPTCPYTGKLLDVRNGMFVHENRQALAAGNVGIHIPQAIIPDLVYNPIQWAKIYKDVKTLDFKKVLQECFGIAVSEGSREISMSDLMRLCVLTDSKEQLQEKCRNGYYRVIASGCDWGGSDYNQALKSKTSYTVHCIIGVAPDNSVDILHWRRYSGMDYPEIAHTIVQEHNAFNGTIIASDFGVGMAYNMELRNQIPIDKHFIMAYVGPKAAPLAVPAGQHLPNQLSLNKTEAITNVFKDIKSPTLKIRCRNWEEMSGFLTDWLNMYRVPITSSDGIGTFKYHRSATKADDGLHAFTFAYSLIKFFLGESLVDDRQLEERLRAVLCAQAVSPHNAELQRAVFGMPNYLISG